MTCSQRFLSLPLLSCATCLALAFLGPSLASAEDSSSIERRLTRCLQYLASDQLAGRGLGTPEIEQAAEYLHHEFEQLGLTTTFQEFKFTKAAKQGPNNRAALVHQASNQRLDLSVNTDFRPLAIGGPGVLDTPLVFVGYGISAPELGYDDYAGLDVTGKTVVVLRHEPRQDDPDSVFNGTDHSKHAPFRHKVKNAIDHQAAGILFCTDQFEVERRKTQWEKRRKAVAARLKQELKRFGEMANPSEEDVRKHRRTEAKLREREKLFGNSYNSEANSLLPFKGAGLATSDERLPVLCVSRSAIDRLLAADSQQTLASLETLIDKTGKPHSFEFNAWRFVANADIAREEVAIKNVVAVLEGAGPTANETIVVGAHFDHLGRGSNAQTEGSGPIHNGADDNASGISLLLEAAGYYSSLPTPPQRRMVFVAFTGEERGLLGSAHYVAAPEVPLESTVAMVNFDMVGRLTDNRLILSGTDTAAEFSPWADSVNERHGFSLEKVPGGMGPSDHASFCAKQIPVLHFFTGLHSEYHRPSDDVELLNIPGIRRIGDYARDMINLILESPQRPIYTKTDGPSRPK